MLACAESGFITGVNPAATVRVTGGPSELVVGDTVQLVAEAADANGEAVSGVLFAWESTDREVATVSSTGRVAALGAGWATISADAGGVVGALTVTVLPAESMVVSVVVEPAGATLRGPGDAAYLTATAYDSGGSMTSGVPIGWASTDDTVVEVDDMGRILARGAGAALVIASAMAAADTAVVTVTPTWDASRTHFVSTAGSDSGPGTETEPWRTLGHALTELEPGETLFVRGGEYVEDIRNPSIRQGRADARIRVAAYPGERPVIRGLLWLERPSYWTLDGINVTWSAGHGPTDHMVQMKNGVGWIYENAEIWGARSFSGLLVYGSIAGEPADWVVRGNCIHDVWTDPTHHINGDHNLYVNTGTSAGRGVIERNLLFNAPNGQNIKLGYGRSTPQPGDGAANVVVRYNTLVGSLKNVMLADETHDITLERNIIVGSEEGYAVRAYRLTGASNVFRDNVFGSFDRLQYGDAGYGLAIDGGGNHFPRDPAFDGVACNQLRPGDAVSRAYGRHAPN